MSDDPEETVEPVAISHTDLSPEALDAVLIDLVSRGEPDEMSLEARCRQLVTALKTGKAQLYFDPIEEAIFLKAR